MTLPTGEQFELETSTASGDLKATITAVAAGIRTLSINGIDLVPGYGEDQAPPMGAGIVLAPWPNRIRDGRYLFEGSTQQLALSEPGRQNASHGLVRWAAWSLVAHRPDHVTLTYRLMSQTGYPWTLDLHVLHDLSADGLTVTVTATNLADRPAPYALGAHPYLTTGTGPVDAWELTVPAATRLLVDDRMLPTGREDVRDTDLDFRMTRPVRSTSLDTAFTDLSRDADGRAEVVVRDPRFGDATGLWLDERHPWLQLFTGDTLPVHAREALAVEPMTAQADAFRSGQDLLVLAPGDTFSASWGIRSLD